MPPEIIDFGKAPKFEILEVEENFKFSEPQIKDLEVK